MVGPPIHDDGRPYYRFAGAEGKVWLMPVDSTLRHTAVKMYAPYSLKGRLFKALMYLGLVGSKVSIEEEALAELEQVLAEALGEEAVRLAFYNPVLPDRRILLIMKPEGGIVAYARMAGTDRARRVLEHEEYVLGLLRAVPALKQHVPKPLAFLTHNNATVLITSAGPGPKGPSVWTPLHSDFSRKLYEAFKKDETLAESKLWQIVISSIESYQPHLTEAWRLRYKLALEKLEPYQRHNYP